MLLCQSFNFSELSVPVIMLPFPGSCYWGTNALRKSSPALNRTEADSVQSASPVRLAGYPDSPAASVGLLTQGVTTSVR